MDGYFNDYLDQCVSCINVIARQGFKYIEINSTYTTAPAYLGRTPGYYKVFAADKNYKDCNVRLTKHMKRKSTLALKEFAKEHCIASVAIDKPSSRYWLQSEKTYSTKLDNWDKSIISRFEDRVMDTVEGKVIARSVDYHLSPWPQSSLSYGKVYDCGDIGVVQVDPMYGKSILKATLKPKNKDIL